MTTLASREIVTAKSSLPVMARHATKRAWSSVMIQRLRRCHFVSLRAGTDAMTIVTVQSLVPVVLLMAEADFESASHLACSCEPARFVAHAARRDISITRFRLRAMAFKARTMCAETRGNGHCHTTTRRSMTAGTGTALAYMSGMGELHIEAAQPGKSFQRTRLRIRVADSANRVR